MFRKNFDFVVDKARAVEKPIRVAIAGADAENILLPGQLYEGENRREEAMRWMERLRIRNLSEARGAELSGGELRRTAIARTLCMHPSVILADEPTGNLDNEAGYQIVEILKEIRQTGTAIIMSTHNLTLLEQVPKSLHYIHLMQKKQQIKQT